MSIPASIVVSKLRYPETDDTLDEEKFALVSTDDGHDGAANWMHAFTNGAWLGVKLAGIVVAVLASVIGLVALCDAVLTWAGGYLNIESLTLEIIFGYMLVPVAFFLGVPRNEELVLVARLIATKILKVSLVFSVPGHGQLQQAMLLCLVNWFANILPFKKNEFLAYQQLQTGADYMGLSPRSRLIATYSLCGFGNLGSLGTQVGLMTQMAPSRNKDIASVAFSAFLTGVVSTLTSAGMAGMLLGGESASSLLQPPQTT